MKEGKFIKNGNEKGGVNKSIKRKEGGGGGGG